MKKNYIILVLISCLFSHVLKGQDDNIFKGFGFEAGAGCNTLMVKHKDMVGSNYNAIYRFNKTWIQPYFKINYTIRHKEKKRFKIVPFIGYYCYGGKSRTEADGYREEYIFKSIETGVYPTYTIRGKLDVSIAAKCQYNFKVINKQYGYRGEISTNPREWIAEDNGGIKKLKTHPNLFLASGIGIKIKYDLYKKLGFGTEMWISYMSYNEFLYKVGLYDRNYRVFLSYCL